MSQQGKFVLQQVTSPRINLACQSRASLCFRSAATEFGGKVHCGNFLLSFAKRHKRLDVESKMGARFTVSAVRSFISGGWAALVNTEVPTVASTS